MVKKFNNGAGFPWGLRRSWFFISGRGSLVYGFKEIIECGFFGGRLTGTTALKIPKVLINFHEWQSYLENFWKGVL